jgi:hypothetical protein
MHILSSLLLEDPRHLFALRRGVDAPPAPDGTAEE